MEKPSLEIKLEACEVMLITLLTFLPEIEFSFFWNSMLRPQPSDDRPVRPPPPESLEYVRELLKEAENGRRQIYANARREP